MIKKSTIAYIILSIALLYIIAPRILEKTLLLNELLAATGVSFLVYKSFKFGYSVITLCITLLIAWCVLHSVVSLCRMHGLYYYLRNLVVFYSIFLFFAGFYLYPYLSGFIQKIRQPLRLYTFTFLAIPAYTLFDRFGMAVLFPALFKKAMGSLVPLLLILFNLINAATYQSSTASVVALFYLLLFLSPGYKFFKQATVICFFVFVLLFIYLIPHLAVIHRYTGHDEAIKAVMHRHPFLSLDPNNTWRLVLWYQIIIDNFPGNLFGIGFGTPLLQYFPVEDLNKLHSLPYVLGAHNSFIYLFGRLGLVFIFLILAIYRSVFREYYYYKAFYRSTQSHLIFLSFFAFSIIAAFNPVLETPIYAGGYWLVLGLLAKTIETRTRATTSD